ncbi:uncharacterized membrane protein YuzA (DUF378 family) [Virgibacillus halotolerans]|uniref:SA1362 family protein n=1 Tax=Virgibacillus halotolerans TaxID=1071053 RepID=UPI001961A58E|nr:SA1362 family protein [Virgibacillus halotolerans]MBM7597987.1 uncharacterized membrane protein YuzA (DUF378 family) [Virgibacillus halotolerans]
MARKLFPVLIAGIIGLAAVGLITQLFTNTMSFFTSIFIMIGVGIVIFAVIYFVFLNKKPTPNEMKKYKKAVKQSKAKYKQEKPANYTVNANKKQGIQKKKRGKRPTHLRVIDGNKPKGKDRASF